MSDRKSKKSFYKLPIHEDDLDTYFLGIHDDHQRLKEMENAAGVFLSQGDYDRAKVIQEKVLSLSKEILGEEHPDTLKAMVRLAITMGNQGDIDGAHALHEKVLILLGESQEMATSLAAVYVAMFNRKIKANLGSFDSNPMT